MSEMIIKDGIRYRLEDLPLSQTYRHLGPIGVAAPLEVPQLTVEPEAETNETSESEGNDSKEEASTSK
ncbi:hypothetical protein QP104_07355 [Alloscardovia omnicolens]|uniref:hypothetical protein n=1 Tax=Alloscardovia omnicolens TaxID=419015 RepID=UPI002550184C|nr:hypothetical protein [Alloscardovia omnicolens]MDK6445729.1 hypothetical protein [Alloscardovia omnicolens]